MFKWAVCYYLVITNKQLSLTVENKEEMRKMSKKILILEQAEFSEKFPPSHNELIEQIRDNESEEFIGDLDLMLWKEGQPQQAGQNLELNLFGNRFNYVLGPFLGYINEVTRTLRERKYDFIFIGSFPYAAGNSTICAPYKLTDEIIETQKEAIRIGLEWTPGIYDPQGLRTNVCDTWTLGSTINIGHVDSIKHPQEYKFSVARCRTEHLPRTASIGELNKYMDYPQIEGKCSLEQIERFVRTNPHPDRNCRLLSWLFAGGA